MCGIVAYIGCKHVVPLLVEGLKRLEYRGYDSSGVAVIAQSDRPSSAHRIPPLGAPAALHIRRAVGRISVLEDRLSQELPLPESHLGMAHTRWATHGAPTEVNAHPHTGSAGRIALVHNGIIENYAT